MNNFAKSKGVRGKFRTNCDKFRSRFPVLPRLRFPLFDRGANPASRKQDILTNHEATRAMPRSLSAQFGRMPFRSFAFCASFLLLLLFPVASSPSLSGYAPVVRETAAANRGNPVALRDITVTPGNAAATITLLVDGKVETVVIEKKGKNLAQIRMKSLSATPKALNSALPKPGVISVQAHIERTDVLVTDVRFTREVKSIAVTARDAEKVVVRVSLGGTVAAGNTGPTVAAAADHNDSWKLTTIVLDAGHGGKDPGAIGIGNIREKDITLATAKYLRDELKRTMPGVKVVMTRDDDRFVELFRRGEIANEKGGRLFVSIHCNSMPEKPHPASGFECWILRPGRSDDAARVASRENGVIRYESDRKRYDSLDAEIAILGSLAQSAFARFSEQLADNVRRALKGTTNIPDRGVHQAGFYVLVGASMPAVLIELGYLSNEKDAKILKEKSGQKKMAAGIAKGIRNYAKAYAQALK